jgi:hypothetical protein
MKSGFLGAIAFLLVSAGWAAAQAPAAQPAPGAPAAGGPAPPSGGFVYPNGPVADEPIPSLSGPVPNGSCLPDGACVPGGGGGCVLYGEADYLLFRIRDSRIPNTATVVPVGLLATPTTNAATTITPAGTPAGTTTTTQSNFATASITSNGAFANGLKTEFSSQNGGRFRLGFWADPEQTWGLEATGLLLERGTDHFSAVQGAAPNQFVVPGGTANQSLIVGGVLTPVSSTQVFLPRASTASLVGSASNTLYGGEINARCVGLRFGCVDVGGLFGFRYLLYKDELGFVNNVRLFLPPGFSDPAGAGFTRDLDFTSADRIRMWNHFFGGQAGIDMDIKFGSFFIYARGQLALGDMHQVAQVDGLTQVNNRTPGTSPPSNTVLGGLLSSPVDLGHHSRDRFSYIPEVNVKFGYQFTSWLRGYVGYDALVIGHAGRAGDSSTTSTVNSNVSVAGSSATVNVNQPTFRFRDTDVWAQGLTFGMEVRY